MPTQIDNTTKQQIKYFTIYIAHAKRLLVTDSYRQKEPVKPFFVQVTLLLQTTQQTIKASKAI
jgi:hypothetical protein